MLAVYHLVLYKSKVMISYILTSLLHFSATILAMPYDFSHEPQEIPATKATIGKSLSVNKRSLTDTEISIREINAINPM